MIYTALDICSLRPIKCDSFAQIMFSSNSQGSSSLNRERPVAMEEFVHVSHTSNHTNCFMMEFTVNPWGKGWPIAGGGWGVGTAPKSCVQNASLRPVCTWRGMLSLSLLTHAHTHTNLSRQTEWSRSMPWNILSQFMCQCCGNTGAGGGPPLSWKHQFLISSPHTSELEPLSSAS